MKVFRILLLSVAVVSLFLGSCARRQAAPAPTTVPDYVDYGK